MVSIWKKSKIGIYKIDDKLKLKEVHATYTCKQNESNIKIVGKEEIGLLWVYKYTIFKSEFSLINFSVIFTVFSLF